MDCSTVFSLMHLDILVQTTRITVNERTITDRWVDDHDDHDDGRNVMKIHSSITSISDCKVKIRLNCIIA